MLRDTLAVIKRIHKVIHAAKKTVEIYEAYQGRLRSQLQDSHKSFGNSFSIKLSSESVLALLDPLNDLDSMGGARILTLRSKIA